MVRITQEKAERIAVDFLEQYHPTVTVESNLTLLNNETWIVTGKIGLVNRQIREVLIDGNNGKILSFTERKLSKYNYEIKKAQVALAIEKALLKIGSPIYDKVVQRLYDDHRCYLYDCYEYPEYLHNVIKEIFGDNYKVIVESIKTHLKKASEQKDLVDFVNVISK